MKQYSMLKMRNWGLKTLGTLVFLLGVIVFSGNATSGADGDAPSNVSDIETNAEVEEAQMIPMAENQMRSAEMISVFVQSMLDRSRKENDTVKILCLDDKLTQIHALLEGTKSRMNALNAALVAKDTTGARHQFVILQVGFNKLNGLRVQADACVGNSDIVAGSSETDVTKASEDVTVEEATTPEQEVFTPEPVVRPTIASGFR
ncbi:MAG: hypothetical protein JXX29_18015 [Deltaproteobacteria bacterium]|nr:hypothetical protein [Deltaproteobacteria bacterium]MBN2673583.1 hypothetical protein [Deltaproteobacteria bacterium]